MTVAAMLLIVIVLWGACILSIGFLAWSDRSEDLGRVSEGWVRREGMGSNGIPTTQLRLLRGGRR